MKKIVTFLISILFILFCSLFIFFYQIINYNNVSKIITKEIEGISFELNDDFILKHNKDNEWNSIFDDNGENGIFRIIVYDLSNIYMNNINISNLIDNYFNDFEKKLSSKSKITEIKELKVNDFNGKEFSYKFSDKINYIGKSVFIYDIKSNNIYNFSLYQKNELSDNMLSNFYKIINSIKVNNNYLKNDTNNEADILLKQYIECKNQSDEIVKEFQSKVLNVEGREEWFNEQNFELIEIKKQMPIDSKYELIGFKYIYDKYDKIELTISFKDIDLSLKSVDLYKSNEIDGHSKIEDTDYLLFRFALSHLDIFNLNEENFDTKEDYVNFIKLEEGIWSKDMPVSVDFNKNGRKGIYMGGSRALYSFD